MMFGIAAIMRDYKTSQRENINQCTSEFQLKIIKSGSLKLPTPLTKLLPFYPPIVLLQWELR